MIPTPPLLEVRQATKRFPGVLALERVDLQLNRGEVVAVIGENGAGKSTLMGVLAGITSLDAGMVLIDGQPVEIDSVHSAIKQGIALIHQELNLCDNLDVAANIFLGRELRRRGFLDRPRMEHGARQALERIGLDLPPQTLVSSLSIGRQQLVEIAKALSMDARIVIMDEPTSSLSAQETKTLLRVVRQLRDRGVGVIYISHRLAEVSHVADRVVALRDGRSVGELRRDEINRERMVRLMVGRELAQFYSRQPHTAGDVVLEARGLVVPRGSGQPIDLKLRRGEIVGLAGLVGSGRSELLRTLFAIDPPAGGRRIVDGRPLRRNCPAAAIAAGIALVPEDRKQQGLILEMAVRQNISLAGLRKNCRRGGLMNMSAEKSQACELIRQLAIRTPSDRQIARYLSGGNQQKVVLAKWLALKPRVLLMDEPTRGIDVGAKQEIYRIMEELAGRGVAILFASSEMEEILGMSDRVLVMHDGLIAGELPREQLAEEAIMQLATGGSVRPMERPAR